MNKTTTAWGWLAAGVLALGVNGFLHDEGAGLARQMADRVGSRSAAMVALASGRADEFLARMAENDAMVARVNVISAREQAQLDRLEAGRARMEARLEAQRNRMQAQMVNFQFANVVVDPVKVRVACPRVRVNVSRPMVRIPAPVIHMRTLGAGPV